MNQRAGLWAKKLAVLTGIAWLMAGLAGWLAYEWDRRAQQQEQLSLLKLEAGRQALELMSITMNGNLMGGIALMGVMEAPLKQSLQDKPTPATEQRFANLGPVLDATGVIGIGQDGIVKASWDSTGRSSLGMNVAFRPYFRTAMLGQENVYAAISLARDERALYFSVPVFADVSRQSPVIGAVAARTDLQKVDALLKHQTGVALLLSPQGVVFASSRAAWLGSLAGEPTAERVQSIRQLKQFGRLYDQQTPTTLPFDTEASLPQIDGATYLSASAPVVWHDPSGDWRLMLLVEATQKISPVHAGQVGAMAALVTLVLLWLSQRLLRSQLRQSQANQALQAHANQQSEVVSRKTRLAEVAIRFQQAESPEDLGARFLSEAHRLCGSLQGVLYGRTTEGAQLDILACYACLDQPAAQLQPAETLLGAAFEQGEVQVVEADASFWKIRSGLGGLPPKATVLLPIALQEMKLGIAELAFLTSPDPLILETLREMSELLALNLVIQLRSRRSENAVLFQQTLLDMIPYPVFYKGLDTRFVGFNRAYEQAFAVSRESLIGKRVMDLEYLPLADREIYQAEDEQTIAQCGQIEREMMIPFADGQLHRTRYFVSGFKDAHGKPAGLIGTFFDLGVMDGDESVATQEREG